MAWHYGDKPFRLTSPSFVIKIDGTRLPPDKEADVNEIFIFEKTDAPAVLN